MKQRLRTKVKGNLDYFINSPLFILTRSALISAHHQQIKKVVSPTVLFLILFQFVNSQSAGDLAFIGWNSDGNDDVVFILMADFSENTKIYIRDDEYNNGWDGTGEGTISWTVPGGGSSEGTMVEINNASTPTPTVNTGSVTREDAGFNISNTENAVYAYTSNDAFNSGTFTFLAGFCNATSTSELTGTSLTDDTDFWSWGNKDNWKYTGSTTSSSVSEMKTNLQSSSNWTSSDGSGDQSYDFTFSDFSLPVELTLFTAVPQKGSVKLSWVTESEIDNLGFLIDRSLNPNSGFITIADYRFVPELQGQGSVTYRTGYSYTDKEVVPGTKYYYILSDVTGNPEHGEPVTRHTDKMVSATPKWHDGFSAPIKGFKTFKAYPNPFNPKTVIAYELEDVGELYVSIIDVYGRQVMELYNGFQASGFHEITWQPKDTSAGIYFCHLTSGGNTITRKLVLLK